MYFGETRARTFFESVPMLGADLFDSLGKDFSIRFPGQ